MQYRLNINNRSFDAIRSGIKKVETRVSTDRNNYSKLKAGDRIIFINDNNENQICLIKEINWYKNEKELLIQEGIRYTLSSTNNFENGIKLLTRFEGYKEGIKKNGIYAIHIECIEDYHEMKLQEKYFNFILNGTKRIEIRLFDEKRQKIKLGDTIKFLKESNLDESFETKVVGLLRYDSFANMINDFDISILSDKSMTKKELIAVLAQFYTNAKQQQYGVLGIKIELL